MNRLALIGLSLLLCLSAHADTIEPKERLVRFTLPNHAWNEGDELCIVNEKVTFACGRVIKTTPDVVNIHLTAMNRSEKMTKGTKVKLVELWRRPTGHLDTYEVVNAKETLHTASISLGMGMGFHYFFPEGQFQWALSNSFSIGSLLALATSTVDTTNVHIFGAFATAQFFPSGRPFSGLGLGLGLGYYSFRVEKGAQTESLSCPALTLTGAWNFRIASGFTIGIKAGAQYFLKADSTIVDLDLTGLRPLGGLNLGWVF